MTKAVARFLTTSSLICLMAGVGTYALAVDGGGAKHQKGASSKKATSAPANSQAEYEDAMITYKIRQSINNDVTLSQSARNLKIETAKGVVSVKGPVANVAEKSIVLAMAEAVAGKANVKGEIEVAK